MLEYLKDIVSEIAREEKLQMEVLSKDWIIKLSKEGKLAFIVGSKFSINSDTASKIASDKYATYEVLKNAEVPVIEHRILFHPQYRKNHPSDLKDIDAIEAYFKEHQNQLVVKANDGFGGKSVYLCKSMSEISQNVNLIFERNTSLSVCPYYEVETEYRVIMLDGIAKLVFGKKKAQGNWKCNLSQGASVVEVEEELKTPLINLAQKAVDAIGIRFASVDIIRLTTGELLVMEVNSGVTIHQYTKFVKNGREIAKEIYREAILKMLK